MTWIWKSKKEEKKKEWKKDDSQRKDRSEGETLRIPEEGTGLIIHKLAIISLFYFIELEYKYTKNT